MPRCASSRARRRRRAAPRAARAGATRPSRRASANAGGCWCGCAPLARHAQFHRARCARASRFAIACTSRGRVLPAALNARLALAHDSIDTLRARIAARIARRVADPDAAALLTALAVGLTDGMSADQWRVFNATGTTHLVAISGLHVTLFALLAFVVRAPAVALAALGARASSASLSRCCQAWRRPAAIRCSPASRCPRSAPG